MEVDEPHDVLTLGPDRPSTWWRIVLALVVAAALAFSGYRLLSGGAGDAAKADPRSGPLTPRSRPTERPCSVRRASGAR